MPITHTPYTRLIALCLGLVLSGCATSIGNLPVFTAKPEDTSASLPETGQKAVSVRYLGVGGYLIRYGKNAVMTAPSITNPSLLKIASLTRLKTNEALVDSLMPPAQDVEMILVGHSHYDHLLDVPYIMRKHARNAVVYGSKTMGNIIAPAVNKSCIVAVDQHAAHGKTPGQWIYNQSRTVRFMAIESEHAPHIMGLKVLPKGPYQKRLKRLPRTVFGWVEGERTPI